MTSLSEGETKRLTPEKGKVGQKAAPKKKKKAKGGRNGTNEKGV